MSLGEIMARGGGVLILILALVELVPIKITRGALSPAG